MPATHKIHNVAVNQINNNEHPVIPAKARIQKKFSGIHVAFRIADSGQLT